MKYIKSFILILPIFFITNIMSTGPKESPLKEHLLSETNDEAAAAPQENMESRDESTEEISGDIEEGGQRSTLKPPPSLLRRLRDKLFTKHNAMKSLEMLTQGTICALFNLFSKNTTPKIFAQHNFAESLAKNIDPQFDFIPQLKKLSPEAMNNLRKTIALAVKSGVAIGMAYAWLQLDDYLYEHYSGAWTGFSAAAMLAFFKYIMQYFEHIQEDNCKPDLKPHRRDEHDDDEEHGRGPSRSIQSMPMVSITSLPHAGSPGVAPMPHVGVGVGSR